MAPLHDPGETRGLQIIYRRSENTVKLIKFEKQKEVENLRAMSKGEIVAGKVCTYAAFYKRELQ